VIRVVSHSGAFALLAAVGLSVVVQGCDGTGSKRDSLYEKLRGAWRIERVTLDGAPRRPVDDAVRIEFSQDNGQRSYRIIRGASGDTSRVGRVGVPQSNVLTMRNGFGSPLTWRFEFDGSVSVRFQLRKARSESIQEFLAAIGLGGRSSNLTLNLIRDSN
jgi:hypothetical protein